VHRSSTRSRILTVIGILAILATTVAVPVASAAGSASHKAPTSSAVFFAADGLRQDLVQKYADQGVMPTMRSFLRNGVKASGNGMLTQAPPNTGAGWYTMATGAWPGVHGSTNNTFHKSGPSSATFGGTRTAAFDAGVLQAETIAQSAERGGPRSPRWSGQVAATASSPDRRSTSAASSPVAA
jgi:predicted AlkP superfamily pyrophosphatase or phosphodiesterase